MEKPAFLSRPPANCFLRDEEAPCYIVRWLDHDHESRQWIEQLYRDHTATEANHIMRNVFGLDYGGVSLLRKAMGLHKGGRKGFVDLEKIGIITTMWRREMTRDAVRDRIVMATEVDALGWLKVPSASALMDRIGACVGLSRHTVARVLRNEEAMRPAQKRLYNRVTPKMKESVIQLLHTEMTHQEIADLVAIHRRTVSKISKEAGIIRRGPGPGGAAGITERRTPQDEIDAEERTAKRSARNTNRATFRRKEGI